MNKKTMDTFEQISPIECYKLNIIASYCIILFIICIVFNSILLLIFYRYKKLRTCLNTFIIALTLLNLFGSVTQFPFVIPSNLFCRWLFGRIGCYFSGFTMYSIGCTQIYLMTALSIERYLVVFKPTIIKQITFNIAYITIAVCIFLSVFWSILPFFGWSYYSLEGGLTSCSVEWNVKNWNVYSYNITVWIFAFKVPLVIIVYCNIHMLSIVNNVSKIQNKKREKRIKRERRLTIIVVIQIIGYLMTWGPYALVSMYSAFLNPDHISPLGSTLPAMFAKSSMAWSTILFIYSNKKIKSKLSLNLFTFSPKQSIDFKKESLINNKLNEKEAKKELAEPTIYWV